MKHFFEGYKTKQDSKLFGLYQPVLNCFLIIHDDLKAINEISKISSSRYTTFIVQIDCAVNYQHNLIDNYCCENWTFSNNDAVVIANPFKTKGVISAEELIELTNSDLEIKQEKEYLQTVLYWLEFSWWLESQIPWKESYDFLREIELLDHNDYYSQYYELTKKIKQNLYFSKDSDSSDNEIVELIYQNQDLTGSYELWKNPYYI